ncbi:MAG: macrophage infectivity potentiator Mip [Gammaproteobacteria bacterium]
MKTSLLGVALIAAFSTLAHAADVAPLETQRQKLGYIVGLDIAENLKQQGLDVDADALAQAIKDFQAGTKPRLSEADRAMTIKALSEERARARASEAEANLEAGRRFLAENGKKEGVITTESGLQYRVIKAGDGKQPTQEDTVVAHYRGTLINGEEFDSSYRRGEPATFPVGGVIPGWQEVLKLMKVGSKWQVFIPAELGYGERGAGNSIGPNETLIFDIELVAIK